MKPWRPFLGAMFIGFAAQLAAYTLPLLNAFLLGIFVTLGILLLRRSDG